MKFESNRYIFERLVRKKGNQGIVGILKRKDKVGKDVPKTIEQRLDNKNIILPERCIFKISQSMDNVVRHEYIIMQSLNELCNCCPSFCRSYGMDRRRIKLDYGNENSEGESSNVNFLNISPFEMNENHREDDNNGNSIENCGFLQDTLYGEYISGSLCYYKLMRSRKLKKDENFSVASLVLLAIEAAQRMKGFCHYDLHSENILLSLCEKNSIFLYSYDENTCVYCPTYGYYPILIDYGFSYCDDTAKKHFYCNLSHTEAGLTQPIYDPYADIKVFLVSLSKDFLDIEKISKEEKNLYERFRRIVLKAFRSCPIDIDCGWDENIDELDISIAKKIALHLNQVDVNSGFLSDDYNIQTFIELCGGLYYLPLYVDPNVEIDVDLLESSFFTFANEFAKFEEYICDENSLEYTIRCIVEAADDALKEMADRQPQEEEIKYNDDVKGKQKDRESFFFENNKDILLKFEHNFFEKLTKCLQFVKLNNINLTKLFYSIVIFSYLACDLQAKFLNVLVEIKKDSYSKISVRSPLEAFHLINSINHLPYIFDSSTVVYFWDISRKRWNKVVGLPDTFCSKLNSEKGTKTAKLLRSFCEAPPLSKVTGSSRAEEGTGRGGEGKVGDGKGAEGKCGDGRGEGGRKGEGRGEGVRGVTSGGRGEINVQIGAEETPVTSGSDARDIGEKPLKSKEVKSILKNKEQKETEIENKSKPGKVRFFKKLE